MATQTIHRHASPGVGSVNTWWIETEAGVIVIDGQRQLSQAAEAAQAIARLGRPALGILLTHTHPDHVGGLPALRAAFPRAPILATARAAEALRTDEGGFQALARSFLGDDFAADMPPVDAILPDSGEIELGGLKVAVSEFGLGETISAAVFTLPGGAAFVGDVVSNAMTPWLLEGHTTAWLEQIERLAALLPAGALAHPGHGAPSELDALATAQTAYLRRFRDAVQEAAEGGRLTARARAAVVAQTELAYPGWLPVAGVPELIARNAEGVARELGLDVES